ncbi:MAG: ABC transporter ATP-binding protein [Rhodocyclaceae bacterium]
MTSPIQLDAVSKCYRMFQSPEDRLKQALLDRMHGLFGGRQRQLYREHWALRDVSFELKPGEAVGVLGRNGAGKSTLLQIIAGTLTPSAGAVRTTGRITALLELGSGFNPEFTGRENVFLNAQILGMSRREVQERFDDIAAFADIGKFIDQPVKTYSSGMMMRLAFAVQTAVDPKVLIVDEALAVGDMFFQAKCMARIARLVDAGVALLFVSHDISAVRQLCQRAVLLDGGVVRAQGAALVVSDLYAKMQIEDRNQQAQQPMAGELNTPSIRPEVARVEDVAVGVVPRVIGDDYSFGIEAFQQRAQHHRAGSFEAEILNVQVLRGDAHSTDFDFDDVATIRVIVRFAKDLSNLNLAIKIRTLQGTDVAFFDTRLQREMSWHYKAGACYVFEWAIKLPLQHGTYALAFGLAHPPMESGADWRFVDMVPHAYEFRMAPRQEGMIDGFVSLPATLDIREVVASSRQGSGCE